MPQQLELCPVCPDPTSGCSVLRGFSCAPNQKQTELQGQLSELIHGLIPKGYPPPPRPRAAGPSQRLRGRRWDMQGVGMVAREEAGVTETERQALGHAAGREGGEGRGWGYLSWSRRPCQAVRVWVVYSSIQSL